MMPRSMWSLAAGILLASLLMLSAQPALAADTSPAAKGPASGSLLLQTVPSVKGVLVSLDGRVYETDGHGFVAITTVSGKHHIGITPPRPALGRTVHFSRWLDGLALAERDISLSPGPNREQVGMVVSHPIAVRFTGPHGVPVPLSDVTRVTVDSSLGESFTFAPSHPPPTLPADRIVRIQSGLAPLIIRYSVREVVIDGSNVVYGGKQNFFVHASGVWTVAVLLFPLRIEVKDALFGFGIGSAVRLMLPDGSSRIIKLGNGHAIAMTGLPRATYQLAARGAGFGLTSPTTLSKPQVAKLLLLSWIDILAVGVFAVLFAVGLPVLGRRVIRHPGRLRLPAWQMGGSQRPPTPAPADTADVSETDAGDAGGTPPPADTAEVSETDTGDAGGTPPPALTVETNPTGRAP
jgi:hypothetical protein